MTGWDVRVDSVEPAQEHVARVLTAIPDGALALVDGLVAVRAPAAIEAASRRIAVVVLAHMLASALSDADADGERRALAAARCVIATSPWTRAELVRRGLVDPDRIEVAVPGTDAAPVAAGTATGGHLLAVGVVAPHKGHDLLVRALADLGDLEGWRCTIAGSTETDPDFADRIAADAADAGIGGRVVLAGVLTDEGLEEAYAEADVLVAPSRVESYGIAIADALRHGVPVVATATGGIPQAFGDRRAVVLLPPDEPFALSLALRRWMIDPVLRARLKADAVRERDTLPRWDEAVAHVAQVLESVR
nr:glycosyltransferase family 4 protein [Microbacterium ulmi]